MAVIESRIAPSSEAFAANRAAMLALIDRQQALEERARRASAAAGPRFHERGQLLPRERIALLLDPGAPFLELSTLSGYLMDQPDPDKSVPGSGVIAGIGFVSGVRCMISASDSGIDAGALQPMGLEKQLRVQEMALENRLPFIQLVESAGPTCCATASSTSSMAARSSATSPASPPRACRSSPSPTAPRRPAAPTRRASPTTSSWCAAAPAPSSPARRS